MQILFYLVAIQTKTILWLRHKLNESQCMSVCPEQVCLHLQVEERGAVNFSCPDFQENLSKHQDVFKQTLINNQADIKRSLEPKILRLVR